MDEQLKHVSIIVCHYGQADDFGEEKAKDAIRSRSEMLRDTMNSLITNTRYPSELIVVDNGGKPDDSEYLLELTRRGAINTYIRNKENMNFGWAWNQGAALATGDFLCFTCNDIYFDEGWLEKTMEPLIKYPEKKLIGTPLCTPDKDTAKHFGGLLDEHRLNTFAGSNCMVVRRETYEEIGPFSTSSVAGTHWYRKKSNLGYVVAVTPQNMAHHLAQYGGVNFRLNIPVKKTLLTKEVIDYTWKK